MSIEFRSPCEADVLLMKGFAQLIDAALEYLMKTPEVQHVGQMVGTKLNESLMWFSHGILNQPMVAPVENPAEPPKADAQEQPAAAS